MKGVSPIISSVIYIGLAAGAITTIFGVTQPLLDQMSEANNIQEMLGELPEVQRQIESVAELGEGSQEQIAITFRGGSLHFQKGTDSIQYQIKTTTSIITPGTSRRLGNVRIAAGASVDVTNATVNRTGCWQMENDHIRTCIKTVPEGTSEELLGYWTLDDGSGQNVNDSSTYNNDGTLGGSEVDGTNDPSWEQDCRAGECLNFDGSNDYVEAPDVVGGRDAVSVTAWANPDDFDSEDKAILGQWSVNELSLWYDNTNEVWTAAVQDADGNTLSVSGGNPATTEWTHLTATYDRDNALKLYVNGDEVDSAAAQGNPINNGGSWFGIGYDDDHGYFDGTIDEVAVYNYSMDEIEVQSRYRSGIYDQDFFKTEDLLVRYQNLDSGFVLGNPAVRPFINGNSSTDYGFGYTEIEETGEGLPSGTVTAHVKSLLGIDYALTFRLLSGSDFLEARVSGD